jgi:hypothetical protein
MTQRKDWKALERAYRKMINRLPGDADPALRMMLWTNLAEIYRSRFNDFRAAAKAFEVAATADPGNMDRYLLLAELYEMLVRGTRASSPTVSSALTSPCCVSSPPASPATTASSTSTSPSASSTRPSASPARSCSSSRPTNRRRRCTAATRSPSSARSSRSSRRRCCAATCSTPTRTPTSAHSSAWSRRCCRPGASSSCRTRCARMTASTSTTPLAGRPDAALRGGVLGLGQPDLYFRP